MSISLSFGTDPSAHACGRILAIGPEVPAAWLFGHEALKVDPDQLDQELERFRPDILLIAPEAAPPVLASRLADMGARAPALVLIVADARPEQADAAAPFLDLPPAGFLSPGAPTPHALGELAAILAGRRLDGVADAGARPLHEQQILDLQRDAERVARALAELAAARPSEAGTARPLSAARIRAHLKARRLRERFLPPGLFADPAWDMLLDLAASRLEARDVSVSSLCIAAAVPTTTALRWIRTLMDHGLIERHSDPKDARRAYVRFAGGAMAGIEGCIEAVLNQPGQ